MKKTKAQLGAMIHQIVKVQNAYELDRFTILPLTDPQAVTCYYSHNKSGLFMGELEPYFTTVESEFSLDHTNYWNEWEQQFPKFHIMDVDSTNHMMLLLQPKVYETIIDFCTNLYSDEPMSEKFINSFKKKLKKKHGTLDLKTINKKDRL